MLRDSKQYAFRVVAHKREVAESRGVRRWPEWWSWELELSRHVLKRMIERRFTEVDLREMMHHARRWRADVVEGRWIIETRCRSLGWEVVVEPDFETRTLVVITAYPVSDF